MSNTNVSHQKTKGQVNNQPSLVNIFTGVTVNQFKPVIINTQRLKSGKYIQDDDALLCGH